jgi:hypothetical protein
MAGWLPEAEYLYWWAADRFGWTPDQVDAAPGRLLEWIRQIDAAMLRVRANARR